MAVSEIVVSSVCYEEKLPIEFMMEDKPSGELGCVHARTNRRIGAAKR